MGAGYRDEHETLRVKVAEAERGLAEARRRRAEAERLLNLGPLATGFSRAMFALGAAVRRLFRPPRQDHADSIEALRAELLRLERGAEEAALDAERAEREASTRRPWR
jgi:hypothetical protein